VIINTIQSDANNAIWERINRYIHAIGRGKRKTKNFRIPILFFLGNLDMLPQQNQ